MLGELTRFLGQGLRNPAGVGAVAPSSRALGRRMAEAIDPEAGPVVEIGAGTGALTQEILAAGIRPERLTLLEMNAAFCEDLARRFPGVAVHNRMAQEMPALGLRDLGAVVSGLPLLNMPAETRRAIAAAVFGALAPGAPFIQFTYGGKPPLPAEIRREFGLGWHKSRRIWLNLPPATVYVFRRQARG